MLLLAQDEEGGTLNDEQVLDHTLTMYIAGHETSAKALTWAAVMLAEHPQVAARLRQEVDSVLQGRKPSQADLVRLPYTLQVLKETLRVRGPSYVNGRTPVEDIELFGYHLRKDEYILLSPYTLHRDPSVFPDPERFDPDRFLPENEKRLPRGAFLPFGAGPHVCIGAQFAMLEMHLILAHLAQHVEFSIVPGQNIRPVPMMVLQPSSAQVVVRRRTPA
jgi:cytochrome P450